jgi:hypothetical protein
LFQQKDPITLFVEGVNLMKRILALFMVVIAAGVFAETYNGLKVFNMSFQIAGGETLKLPATDGGPLPAQNDNIKIDAAGFIVSPSKANPELLAVTWVFAFISKKDQKIERVTVEEVVPSKTAILVFEDEAPKLEGKRWSGHVHPIDATPESLPWLYSNEPSIFVFRFSVFAQGEPVQIFYQPAWFPTQMKAAMIAPVTKRASRKE